MQFSADFSSLLNFHTTNSQISKLEDYLDSQFLSRSIHFRCYLFPFLHLRSREYLIRLLIEFLQSERAIKVAPQMIYSPVCRRSEISSAGNEKETVPMKNADANGRFRWNIQSTCHERIFAMSGQRESEFELQDTIQFFFF